MKICFFTPAFPGKHDMSHYAFVKQLVDAIASKGNDCYVVVPYNVLHYKKISRTFEKYHCGDGGVTIYRPYFISFSSLRALDWIKKITRKKALKKAISKLPEDIDVVYGHFWNSGYEGYQYARSNGLPLFIATGESDIRKLFSLPEDILVFKDYVSGVICVSSKNKEESIRLGLTIEEKCGIFPNAVNERLFYKRDKEECRNLLNLPQNEFIVAYVGWFNERKGSLRVAEAINHIGNVKSVFIGKGDQEPNCEGVLFKGALSHDKVPLYLAAADCFVLPTRAEGCCNAVVEAMACGLPVISSNLPFNWDVLDDTNSILIDPNSVEQLENAIRTLRDNSELCKKLAEGSLKKAKGLSMDKRAERIISFIESKK